MSDVTSVSSGSNTSSGSGVEAPRGGLITWLAQVLAFAVIIAAGGVGAKYVMSIERAMPKDPHGHGPGEKKDAQGAGGHEGHDHGAEKKLIKLTAAQLKNAALAIEPASAAMIRETVALSGIIQPNEEQVVAVLPRFGGIVRSVKKKLGEPVQKGEVIASVESNESLTQYQLTAPISGVVIERKGALGEYADKDKRLMVIADLSTVWVDLRVYQQDFSKLKLGQAVEVALNGTRRMAKIDYVSPIGVTDTQSLLARAVVDNKDGAFRPGLFVTGRVLLGEQTAPVAVKQSAIQFIEGKPVVFVEGKEGFEAREVEFGLKDDLMIEVIFGIVAGERVVTGNSFVLKAELGKGEATHEH